ncbi:MAG: hypothetical protein V3W22_05280, partial [Thermoplasmata archaeon]
DLRGGAPRSSQVPDTLHRLSRAGVSFRPSDYLIIDETDGARRTREEVDWSSMREDSRGRTAMVDNSAAEASRLEAEG